MITLRKVLWLLPLLLAVSCAQLGLQTPETTNQKIAYVYSNISQLRLAASDALVKKQISRADAVKVLDATDQARAAVDRARRLQQGGVEGGTTVAEQLALASSVLTAAQEFLTAQAKKGVK